MNTNEAPEKIYILPHTDYSDRRILNAFTEKENNNDIEYTRTDAFVEKAENFFTDKEAIYENQDGQPAHFDNQSKLCRLLIGDIRCGLIIARDALNYLSGIEIIED